MDKSELLDRIRGCFFGLAIGDALGFQGGKIEFNSSIRPSAPKVMPTDSPCTYSDDTQMTRCVAEGLIRGAGSRSISTAAEEIAEWFVAWARGPEEGHRMPGGACLYGCRALAAGVEWQKAGRPGAGGCGAAMRSAPYGLWFHGDVDKAAEWAGAHSNMTHRHPMADASAAAVAAGVAEAIQGLDYHRVARMMIRAARPRDLGTAKMLRYAMRASAPIPADLATARDDLVYDRLRGWSGDEAVAGGLYAFLRHPQSYQDAILLAVNTPGDSDSLGAITGALSGAWLGFELIPARWRARVEGREWLETLSSRFVESMERAGVLEEPSDASNCLTPWRKAEA